MDLCPATFRPFVVQWSAKIAGRRPLLKALSTEKLFFTSTKKMAAIKATWLVPIFSSKYNKVFLNLNVSMRFSDVSKG